MHYSFEVEVLTTHTSSAKLVYPIKLASGILTGVDLLFEVGDGFSSCVQIWNRGNQILPSNADGFYCADGQLLHAPVWYDIDAEDNALYVLAWNRGGTYDHAVNVMLSVKAVDEPDMMSLQQAMISTVDRLITLMRSVF